MPHKLTEQILKTITVDRRTDLLDEKLPTFGVRISPSGVKSFFVLYTLRGERRKRRYTIGPWAPKVEGVRRDVRAGWSLEEARLEAQGVIGRVAHGEDPQGEKMGERGAIQFEELARRYLDHVSGGRAGDEDRHRADVREPAKRTWRQDERVINAELIPAWKGRSAASIGKRDVLEVVNTIARRAPVAANRVRVLISRVFRWGAEQDLVEHLPTTGTRPPTKEAPGERVLTPAELGAAYHRAGAGGALGDVVRLLVLTWLRRAEVTELEIRELRESGKVWQIPGERMKNKRPHVVPLPAAARAIVEARLAVHPGGQRLFLNRAKEPLHPDSVSDYIATLAAEMEGEPFTQRDIRRTCTTLGGRLGISKDTRARLLSHTDPTVTGKHYDRYDYLDEKREALEQWARYVVKLAQRAATSDTSASRLRASSSKA